MKFFSKHFLPSVESLILVDPTVVSRLPDLYVGSVEDSLYAESFVRNLNTVAFSGLPVTGLDNAAYSVFAQRLAIMNPALDASCYWGVRNVLENSGLSANLIDSYALYLVANITPERLNSFIRLYSKLASSVLVKSKDEEEKLVRVDVLEKLAHYKSILTYHGIMSNIDTVWVLKDLLTKDEFMSHLKNDTMVKAVEGIGVGFTTPELIQSYITSGGLPSSWVTMINEANETV